MSIFQMMLVGTAIALAGGGYGYMAGRHLNPASAEPVATEASLPSAEIISAGQFVVPVEDEGGDGTALLLAEINVAVPSGGRAARKLNLTRPHLRNTLLEALFDLSAKGSFTQGPVSPQELGADLKTYLEAAYRNEVAITAILFDRLLLQDRSSGPL